MSSGTQRVDIVIVGGGAIGACQALALDRLGYEVALIERGCPRLEPTNPERVVALNEGSRIELERLGVWPTLVQKGTGRIRHILVNECKGASLVRLDADDFRRRGTRLDALGHVVDMAHLLQACYERLSASGVHLWKETMVRRLHVDSEKVDVGLSGAAPVANVQARLLIGADGTHSQIRRLAGIAPWGWDYNRFGLVASIRCEHAHEQTAFECFRSSGPLAYLPLADGRYSIVWAVRPREATRLLHMEPQAFRDALTQATDASILERTGRIEEVSPLASYPLELTLARRFTRPRIALVGNAAHTIHPVAGQGMNLGLRDVLRLSAALDSSVGRRDPGQPIVLQAYSEGRRLDVAAVAAFTEGMVDLFGLRLPGARALRSLGMRGLQRTALLRDLLIDHAAGLAQEEAQREVFCA